MHKCRSVATGWLRVGGTLAALFGFYYLGAAYGELSGSGLSGFYLSTVIGRLALSGIFVVLTLRQEVGNGLLVLAVLNAAGALSMASALRKDRQAAGELP